MPDDPITRRREKNARRRQANLVVAGIAVGGVLLLGCLGVGGYVAYKSFGAGSVLVNAAGPTRDLTRGECDAMEKEYTANPVTAADRYVGGRVRFRARVTDITADRKVRARLADWEGGPTWAPRFEFELDAAGVRKVAVEQTYTFEGTLTGYKPRDIDVPRGPVLTLTGAQVSPPGAGG